MCIYVYVCVYSLTEFNVLLMNSLETTTTWVIASLQFFIQFDGPFYRNLSGQIPLVLALLYMGIAL